jgi:hypothetical protein
MRIIIIIIIIIIIYYDYYYYYYNNNHIWLKISDTFRETLGFGFAIEDKAIPPRTYLKYIIKNPYAVTDACLLCGSSSETIQHGITSSPKVAQITYQHRRDQVANIFHQEVAKQLRLLEEPYSPYNNHILHTITIFSIQ